MTDLAELTDLPPSAVRRVVHTLHQLGYLCLDSTTDRYHLATEALTFASGEVGKRELCEFAAPLMEELVEATRVSAAIGIRHGFTMTCIEARRSRAVISLEMDIGTELPLANTAIGRAYLAACGEDERAAILRKVGLVDVHGAGSFDLDLDRVLATHELLGACCSFGEWLPDINGIAVGFQPGHGLPTMAMNCGAPAAHVSAPYLLNVVRPRLLDVVSRIKQEFGQTLGHQDHSDSVSPLS
jgi:DNA-binding IclR family transcriptional regulator